jgi:hypothetical protein
VNEARLSFQRGTARISTNEPFTDTQVGIAPIIPQVTALDELSFSGLFTVGTGGGSPTYKFFTDFEAGDEVSWTHGRQTIRFGGEYERDRANWLFEALSIGQMTFNTFQDFLLGLPGCNPALFPVSCNAANPGNSNGSPLSNNIFSGGYQAVTPPGGLDHHYQNPFADAFIEDDIKLKRQLTVNLGLRWEYLALPIDSGGLTTNIYTNLINTVPIPGPTPATGTLAGFVVPSNYNFAQFPAPPVGGVIQSQHKGWQQDNTPLDDFEPRLGLAWSPLARLVIRSGAGFFYDREGGTTYIGAIEQGEPYSTGLLEAGPANWFSSEAQPYPANSTLGWTPRYTNFAISEHGAIGLETPVGLRVEFDQSIRIPAPMDARIRIRRISRHSSARD